jgi:cyanosortase A-associated protein
MKRHNSYHLVILLLGVLICIVKVLVNPVYDRRTEAALLPGKPVIPLGWSLQHEEVLPSSELSERYNYSVAGRRYNLYSGEHQLLLELREIGNTTGDVKILQTKYTENSIGSAFIVRHTNKGEYYFLEQSDRVELQTCLYHSRFSVAGDTFRKQAYHEIVRPYHLQNWLLGRTSLLNDRCLWVRATIKPAIPMRQIESLLAEIASFN